MMAFFGGRLQSGIGIVIDATRLRDRLVGADLCITGEGRFDSQSLSGKTAIGVARLCKELHVPCVVLAGSAQVPEHAALEEGAMAWFSITNGPMPLADAMTNAAELITCTAGNVMRVFRGGARR